MKTVIHLGSVVWLVLTSIISVQGQEEGRHKPKPKPSHDCDQMGFNTDVVEVKDLDEGCIQYTLQISTDGNCRYDLSHFTVAIPCGTVSDISNSRNWKQEIGKDPTSGLKGFKIDNIPSFGKKAGDSFSVVFTVCSDESCKDKPTVVAYKAGQCIKYDSLTYDPDDGGDDDDDDDDDDGGGDDGGGDDGGGDDDDETCSTLLASISKTNITCNNASDGKLAVTIEDGTDPITYQWSTGATTASIENLPAGDYGVTIADSNGNTLTLNAQLVNPDPLMVEGVLTQPSCGSINGSIDVTVAGGRSPFVYAWSNGVTTQDINNVGSGGYVLTVTDAGGCSVQKVFSLAATTQVTLSSVVSKTTCGQATGNINLSVTGGEAPYAYAWSNGASSEDLQNLATGSYRVVVTDANGCQSMGNYFVQEITTLQIAFVVQKSNCFNEPTGSIDITVSGGSAPYTFAWQHGPTTEDVSNLISGIYRVTVTDAADCSALAAILVQRESLQVTAQVIQPKCATDETGSVILTPINGSGPYEYEWSNGNDDNSIENVPAGTYTVIVRESSGCSTTLSYTLSAPTSIVATAVVNNDACDEEGNFNISLNVIGGKFPYSFQWSSGETTQNLAGINSGTYEVTVTDANNCSVTANVEVSASDFEWECLINNPGTTPVCHSVGNSISSSVADATSYTWELTSSDNTWSATAGTQTNNLIYSAGSPGSTATFTLTIEKNGCIRTCSYEVTGGCIVKDNTGGGDPGNGDPCAEDEPVETPGDPIAEEEDDDKFHAFPNPFDGEMNFEWIAKYDDFSRLDVFDQYGRLIKRVYEGPVRKGRKYSASWDGRSLDGCLFFYRYTSSHEVKRGKILKR